MPTLDRAYRRLHCSSARKKNKKEKYEKRKSRRKQRKNKNGEM